MNKHTRNSVFGIMILCLSLGHSAVFGQDKESLSRGAVILADKTEPVTFFDENNQPLAKTTTIPGVLLPVGASVQTGAGGGALLLLSNGTVVTISANTKMKISSFVQEPFDDKGQSVGDLKEEPSSSSVLVDLEVGDLVHALQRLPPRLVLRRLRRRRRVNARMQLAHLILLGAQALAVVDEELRREGQLL